MTNALIESEQHSQHRIGVIYALVGTALFSIKPVLIKLAYQAGGDATAIMSLRAISSLPFYLLILVWLCRLETTRISLRQSGWQAAAVGILGYYLASLLDITSLAYISAQLERLLIFLYPTFVIIISVVVLKEKLKRGMLSVMLLGYVGVLLIFIHDLDTIGAQVWVGSGLAICSALVFAFYLVLSKQVITKLGGQLFTSVGMSSAGLIIMLQYSVDGMSFGHMSVSLIGLGIATGIFCTVLPSYFVAAAMSRLTPSVMSLTGNIGPVVTTVFAVTLLGESFSLFHALGISLVVYSVVLIGGRR